LLDSRRGSIALSDGLHLKRRGGGGVWGDHTTHGLR